MTRIDPPLKWHGGKYYLAPKIVALMPKHLHYVEPFAGGLSVLLAKSPEGVSEVVNDLHGDLVNFWRVLRCPERFEGFRRYLESTPFCEKDWEESESILQLANSDIRAAAFFIRCRQSLAGRRDTFAPLSRTRTRRGMNEQASAWWNSIEGLPIVHARLKRVVILNRNALDVIRQQDGSETLFYLDPPYLHETRSSCNQYDKEMSTEEHIELLETICKCRGNVMLSAYPSELYSQYLPDWNQHQFTLPNQASGSKQKRRMTEIVWTNF